MIIATAGHVDHGKTALVKHLTGTDTDRMEEEKKRGLSINLGFAYQPLDDQVIGFVDVPGHVDFINNMLAGVSAVDFALLVVAADDGVMPQTREHLHILNLLGVQRGAVALTKVDLVAVQRLEEVKQQINEILQLTSLQGSPIFSVSNASGQGIDQLNTYLQKQAKQNSLTPKPTTNQYARFSVDRSFVVKGIGTVVTGTVIDGTISVGDKLMHSSSGDEVRIRGLRIDQTDIDSVNRGQRAAINITLDHHRVARGDWLLAEFLCNRSNNIDAVLTLIGSDRKFLDSGSELHLYHGASHSVAQFRPLHFDTHAAEGAQKSWVRIKSRDPLFCLYGDRFIVRDAAGKRTLAGGRFVDCRPPARKRHSNERRNYLIALDQAPAAAFKSLLKNYNQGVNLKTFAEARNLTTVGMWQLLDQNTLNEESEESSLSGEQSPDGKITMVLLSEVDSGNALALGFDFFQKYQQAIVQTVAADHLQYPERQGITPLDLKRLSRFSGDYSFFQLVLQKLLALNVLSRTGTMVHSPQHRAQDRPEDIAFFARIKPLLQQGELTAPRTRELCEALKLDLSTLDTHLRRLCFAGKIAQVAANRYYLPETLLTLAGIAEELAAQSPEHMFSVIEYRDQSQIGRNLCIQILEYFDRHGFTLRKSNKRLIQKPKQSIFANAGPNSPHS